MNKIRVRPPCPRSPRINLVHNPSGDVYKRQSVAYKGQFHLRLNAEELESLLTKEN